jgi:hypothetical protein
MAPPFSVLVIGVGEFGRHYADLLSRLNSSFFLNRCGDIDPNPDKPELKIEE